MDYLDQLAQFAATTPSAEIPGATLAKTALILADSLGAIVGGMAEPDVQALTARLATGGPAPVIGTALRAAPGTAALLHGTAGTTLEMDEGNQFARGHPGMHTIPAALAVAGPDVSGRDLLAAIAVGYEVGARIGIASALRSQMHPHGTWGTFCAAVAVLRLAGADSAAMRTGLNMAASYGLTTSKQTMLEGGTVRNSFAGVSGQLGVLIGDLVATGFTADADGVGQIWGHVASDRFDRAAVVNGLGEHWEVERNYFKMHSCCRYNHATLDALGQIEVDPAQIARIEVQSYSLAAELNDPAPGNVLAGKFSVPFAVATTLVNGASGVASFTAENLSRPEIMALAAKVTVSEDPAMTALLPDKRPARVTVHLTDGQVLTAATETNRGDWADPYPQVEIEAKYLSLATRLWPDAQAQAVWAATLGLAKGGAASDLFGAMGGA